MSKWGLVVETVAKFRLGVPYPGFYSLLNHLVAV